MSPEPLAVYSTCRSHPPKKPTMIPQTPISFCFQRDNVKEEANILGSKAIGRLISKTGAARMHRRFREHKRKTDLASFGGRGWTTPEPNAGTTKNPRTPFGGTVSRHELEWYLGVVWVGTRTVTVTVMANGAFMIHRVYLPTCWTCGIQEARLGVGPRPARLNLL